MKRVILIAAILIICFGEDYSQTVTVGLRGESIYYLINYWNHTEERVIPVPLSAYIKAGIQYQSFGLDVKGGFQEGEIYFGTEYGLELKYYLTENISPFIAYLQHFNGSADHISSWLTGKPLNFAGIGAEAKLTKVFGLDLTVYFPFGNKGLEYELDFDNPSRIILVSRMGPMIKLGFIFDIIRI